MITEPNRDNQGHFEEIRCVYCSNLAKTKDHAPPKCLLRKPLPSNLLTFPACEKCNNGFSFDELIVCSYLALASSHPDLIARRGPSGLTPDLEKPGKLRDVFERSRNKAGLFEYNDELAGSFNRVFRKTVQGLFYGLYHRISPADQVNLVLVADRRETSVEDVLTRFRPSPLRDITDQPVSDISPSSWHMREPIFVLKLQSLSGGEPTQRAFRLVRDSPVQWESFQPGIFSFAFVQRENKRAICVISLWETLVVAVETPWPDGRGRLRKGKKNPRSRDHGLRPKPTGQ